MGTTNDSLHQLGRFHVDKIRSKDGEGSQLQRRFTLHNRKDTVPPVVTPYEARSSASRIFNHAFEHMIEGPANAIVGGCLSVLAIASIEGFLFLRPKGHTDMSLLNKARFVFNFSLSQLLPSIVWNTQNATTIAKSIGIKDAETFLYRNLTDAPPKRILSLNRLAAVRGAVAGSVVLTQIFALTDSLTTCKRDYHNAIVKGKEPPLNDPTCDGVVLRLAGASSDVTNLTVDRYGRRKMFPIFEKANNPCVQYLLRRHGYGPDDSGSAAGIQKYLPWYWARRYLTNDFHSSNESRHAKVPVFWQVADSRYSQPGSWMGMHIPNSWLFTLSNEEKLLILEADATTGTRDLMNFRRGSASAFDLDLHEVSQGFEMLESLVKVEHRTLKVVLTDLFSYWENGGGRKVLLRKELEEQGLADILIGARAALTLAVHLFLKTAILNSPLKEPIIILETPYQEWFESFKTEMKLYGYQVMDRSEVEELHGSIKGVPFFCYEKTTADTIHTIRRLVGQGLITPVQVCAMCPRHAALDEMKHLRFKEVTYISSSDLFDQLFAYVREEALRGVPPKEIQHELDHNLEDILMPHYA